MKRLFLIIALAALSGAAVAQEKIFSITACTSETPGNSMNFSWATDKAITSATIEVAPAGAKDWKRAVRENVGGRYCNTFDSIYSKSAKGENFYEDVKISKYNATVGKLKKDTEYKYRIIADGDTSQVRRFRTAGAREWSACIISDFHAYSPLYARTKAGMDMVRTAGKHGTPFSWVLHLGDITAWGGSYSFWKNLYEEEPFKEYMWAGVNGNHDNMTRNYSKTTNEFFRDAAAYPHNGYEGEMGVCYHFRYGDVLFIMLNNENMKSEEGLQAAQEWVRKVVKENPAPYKVVCEHYQWFFGADGKTSQYGRWSQLFDELGISLALAGNNHIYVSTHPLYGGEVVEPGKGTVYIQTPSSDNERGVACDLEKPLGHNAEKIKFRWTEGSRTVGGMHMQVSKKKMTLTLLDRNGKILDVTEVFPTK